MVTVLQALFKNCLIYHGLLTVTVDRGTPPTSIPRRPDLSLNAEPIRIDGLIPIDVVSRYAGLWLSLGSKHATGMSWIMESMSYHESFRSRGHAAAHPRVSRCVLIDPLYTVVSLLIRPC